MKYRCKKDFQIEIYDEHGMPTIEYRDIKSGTVWTRDDNADYIGGEVHLDNEETMEWIEISHETLREYFEELNGNLAKQTNEMNYEPRRDTYTNTAEN